MATLQEMADRRVDLIRKALDAVVFAAPYTADAITTLTSGATADLTALPAGWESLGHHTEDDGINWSRDVETADVRSHGSQEPTRRDITSDVSGLHVIAQESKANVLGMFHNIDLTGVTPDATTKEVSFTRATQAQTRYYRVLAVAQDGSGDDALYFARFLPRASITEYAEQAWTKGTEVQYDLTLTAFVDPVLGYSLKEFWGGPAMATLAPLMGFGSGS